MAKLEDQLNQAAMRKAQLDKDKYMMDSQVREQAQVERGKLQAQLEEARKEISLQKTIADGCYRDLKGVQDKLAVESARAAELAAQADKASKDLETARYDLIKSQGSVDQQASGVWVGCPEPVACGAIPCLQLGADTGLGDAGEGAASATRCAERRE